MKGEVCINELDEILKGLEGEKSFNNKPEFYQKTIKSQKKIKVGN